MLTGKHTMKAFKTILCGIAAISLIVSCGSRSNKKAAPAPSSETEETETYITAIERYLSEVIATQYSPGEVSIPFHSIVGVDESNKEDIQVLGDFWVDNYKVSADTLVFVSGGNHPGKMHVRQDAEGHFSVTGFDAVGDGSTFLPTAKAIFGDKFDAFQKVYSDHEKRQEVRENAISAYVLKHGLSVKVYKDYGWPAVEIPAVSKL